MKEINETFMYCNQWCVKVATGGKATVEAYLTHLCFPGQKLASMCKCRQPLLYIMRGGHNISTRTQVEPLMQYSSIKWHKNIETAHKSV